MSFVKALKTISFKRMLIISFLILPGCGKQQINPAIKIGQFSKGDKAIVIFKAEHQYEGMITKGSVNANYDMVKVDQNYTDPKLRWAYASPQNNLSNSNGYDFMMITPGDYVFENFSYNLGDTNYHYTITGLPLESKNIVFGSFTANPGEIIYLGNINVNFTYQNNPITVKNDYNSAMKVFLDKYPELAKYPIKKKLLKILIN